jgi:hypothetical protein
MSATRVAAVALMLATAIGAFTAAKTSAQTVPDLLGILAEGSSYAEFGAPGLPTLPADYFGPGSDPFEGQVALAPGEPLDPTSAEGVIAVAWPAPPVWPADPPGTVNTVEIEIVGLSLKSAQPITVTYFGGTNQELWRVEVGLSVMPPPPGLCTATKTHENGGTYDAELIVQPRFVFERMSDGQIVELDTGLEGWAPLTVPTVVPCDWVHAPDPTLQLAAPSAGLFTSCVLEMAPGDPGSQCTTMCPAAEQFGPMKLELIPAELVPPPEPFSAVSGTEPDGSHIMFGDFDNPPIPADFFGPGSDPFTGDVTLRGEPLGPTTWGLFDDSDTLILRSNSPFDRCTGIPGPASWIDAEIVALNLRAIDPIIVTYNGGLSPEAWDMEMRLSPTGERDGVLAAIKTHDNGGVFDADFAFHPRFVFRRQYDGMEVILDADLVSGAQLFYSCPDGFWVHEAYPPLGLLAPSDGQFAAGVEETAPGDPASQAVRTLHLHTSWGGSTLAYRPTQLDLSAVETPVRGAQSLTASPNPFNPGTTLRFELGSAGPVQLRIFDVQGRLVRTVLREIRRAGRHEVVWNGVDDGNHGVASGVYVGVLETATGVTVTKLAVIK